MENLEDGLLNNSAMLAGPDGLSAPATTSGVGSLSRRQKAAIIIRMIISEGVGISLADLPEDTQKTLIRQMATLKYIDQGTVNQVVEEFLSQMDDQGLSFPGALEGALSLLEGTISSETVARFRREEGLNNVGDPWPRISGMDIEMLLPIVDSESIEVAAVVLSKLKVAKSADILGRINGEKARRIAYAISLTGSIAPGTVDKIGRVLLEQLDARPDLAFDDGPVERVGAILNYSRTVTREEVLDGLEKTDAEFAKEVRKSIFTFANIPARIDPKDVAAILREVPGDSLAKAIAGATGDAEKTSEFLLGNLSKRMAEQIREEVEEVGEVKEADAESAMQDVVGAIRELEAKGEIFLVAGDED